MPTTSPSLAFAKLGELFGPLTFLQFPGNKLLIINSYEAASDLLEKRVLYADRPRMVMIGELLGFEEDLAFVRYGESWKMQRRYLQQAFTATKVRRNYGEAQHRHWIGFMKGISENGSTFLDDLKRTVAEIAIDTAYGRLMDDHGNSYLETNYHIKEIVEHGFASPIDLLPALKHIPQWFPGAGFKRNAARLKAIAERSRQAMFDLASKDSVDSSLENFVASAVRECRERYGEGSIPPADLHAIKHAAFSIFQAGAETTESTFRTLLLALSMNPSLQEAAHAELDQVVGRDRLPTIEDREGMPYLKALILESLRWHPSVHTGVPHRVMSDDIYNGLFIPEGTTVIANLWGISRDPKDFADPTEFKPERFLVANDPPPDPRTFAFGFGRRVCPGKDLALQSVWIGTALCLWLFKIEPLEANPALEKDATRFTLNGAISYTVPFKCRFVPRFEGALEKLN